MYVCMYVCCVFVCVNMYPQHQKQWILRIPAWLSGLVPAFGPGRDPGVPGMELPAWSLLLPLPVSLPLSLSLSVPLMNK